MRVFSAPLRRHISDRAFKNLKERLLDTFAADIAGDGGVLVLLGDLINFVDIDDALLGLLDVAIGSLEELVRACQLLWEHDILITPAMYPAVPLNRNLVRFSVTAENTEEEVDHAIAALKAVRKRDEG